MWKKRPLPSPDERPLPNLLRSFCSCSPLPAYPSIPLSWRIASAPLLDKSLWTLHLHAHAAAEKMRDGLWYCSGTWTFICPRAAPFPWWRGVHEPSAAQIPDLVRMLRCQSQKIWGCVSCLKRHCQKDRIVDPTQHEYFGFKRKASSFEVKQAVRLNFSSHGVIPPYFTVCHGI